MTHFTVVHSHSRAWTRPPACNAGLFWCIGAIWPDAVVTPLVGHSLNPNHLYEVLTLTTTKPQLLFIHLIIMQMLHHLISLFGIMWNIAKILWNENLKDKSLLFVWFIFILCMNYCTSTSCSGRFTNCQWI